MFNIKCMGCDYPHESDFEIIRENGYDCYLALFVRTKSRLVSNGSIKSYPSNTFVLFDKRSPHYYAADSEEYLDDWIQFDSDDDFMSGMNFRLDTPVYIGDSFDLDSYFHMIRNAYYRCQNNNAVIYHLMSAMFREISQCAGSGAVQVRSLSSLLTLRSRIFSNPEFDWSVSYMASQLNVSVTYMQELYHKAFGVSCMSDVIKSRIIKAKDLLISTDKPIELIYPACGYKSVVHFSRQFKKMTGVSPSDWRKKRP